MRFTAPLMMLASLSGCTATIPPVEVTRFHLNQPIAPAPVEVDAGASLEASAYGAAIKQALARIGFGEAPDGTPAAYLAKVSFDRTARAQAKQSPVSIGIGGGSFGGGLGIGVSTQLGLGGGVREIITSRMSVQLIRQGDGTIIWEGRAQTSAPATAPAAQPGLAAEKLASALFRDFPGVSGQTITVP